MSLQAPLPALPPLDLTNVPRWRKATRAALLARRMALSASLRRDADTSIAAQLDRLLETVESPLAFYWPMQGECDLRPVVARWLTADPRRCAALPVVVEKHAPLAFYAWQPEDPMVAGVFGTTIPKAARTVVPRTLLIPLLGFDEAGYRLGYGGGYYDRTLATLAARSIGVGYAGARLTTVAPQAHDRRMDVIVTDAGIT